MEVKPGETVKLSAKGTSDPDEDILTFKWWQYREAGTYNDNIKIENSGNEVATFKIPEHTVKGNTVHIICEVQDSGKPQLTRYQRVIITVK